MSCWFCEMGAMDVTTRGDALTSLCATIATDYSKTSENGLERLLGGLMEPIPLRADGMAEDGRNPMMVALENQFKEEPRVHAKIEKLRILWPEITCVPIQMQNRGKT